MTTQRVYELLKRAINLAKVGSPIKDNSTIDLALKCLVDVIKAVNHLPFRQSALAGYALDKLYVIEPLNLLFLTIWVSKGAKLSNANMMIQGYQPFDGDDLVPDMELHEKFQLVTLLMDTLRSQLPNLSTSRDISFEEARKELDYDSEDLRDRWAYNGLVYTDGGPDYFLGAPVAVLMSVRNPMQLNTTVDLALEKFILSIPKYSAKEGRGKSDGKRPSSKQHKNKGPKPQSSESAKQTPATLKDEKSVPNQSAK